MTICPNDPVSFLDARGIPWWGVAVSDVITVDQPWPVVKVQVTGLRGFKVFTVPARDVQLMRTSVAVVLDVAA